MIYKAFTHLPYNKHFFSSWSLFNKSYKNIPGKSVSTFFNIFNFFLITALYTCIKNYHTNIS